MEASLGVNREFSGGDPAMRATAKLLRVVIYVRVSTSDQNCELQLRDLHDYAARHGWNVVDTYQDVISGAKAHPPALDRLLDDARSNNFDSLLVWKLDRFGRSLVDCLNHIQVLESCGVRFIAVTQGLDTDQRNPASRFLLQILGAAAEFERELIRERTRAGQIRYREAFESGKVGSTVHSRSGRDLPPHRPRKIFNRDEVISLRRQGLSLRQIAKRLGIGLGTASRTLRERSRGSGAGMDDA
jgi:DNA invertase Pin-like site-specific DNA recombinase